jgi:histidine triad (HIT) family protein
MAASGPAVAGCTFCEIVAGTRAAAVVLHDDVAVGFLDVRPVFPGHTLVVPRIHHETLVDLPADDVGGLFRRARLLARAVEEGLGADGSFVAVNNRVSQSVRHLHVHVVPRRRKDGLRGFFWPRQRYGSEAERDEVAGRLRQAVDAISGERGG